MFVKLPVGKGQMEDFVHVNPAHVVRIKERADANECVVVDVLGICTVIALSPSYCARRLDRAARLVRDGDTIRRVPVDDVDTF